MSILRTIPALLSRIHLTATFKMTPYTASTVHQLLGPINSVLVTQNCGMKVMGKVKRRCKDCYLVWRENRLYNMCKTHGRHKQVNMAKSEKNSWILSHATQGKIRPW